MAMTSTCGAFPVESVKALLDTMPSYPWRGAATADVFKWIAFVCDVDPHDTQTTRGIEHYLSVARLLATDMQSLDPRDYAGKHNEQWVLQVVKRGMKPFPTDEEESKWKSVVLTQAQAINATCGLALANIVFSGVIGRPRATRSHSLRRRGG